MCVDMCLFVNVPVCLRERFSSLCECIERGCVCECVCMCVYMFLCVVVCVYVFVFIFS